MKSITRASLISLIVAFAAQLAWAGGGTVHVRSYTRKDGTYVHAHNRAAPGTASSTAGSTSSIGGSTRSTASMNSATTSVSSAATTTPRSNSYTGSARFSSSSTVQRDSRGRIKRSESAKHDFMRMTGYPHGRPGYVVDHIIPLKRGGPDVPSNMQWQTIQEAKAKDKVE